MSSTIHPTAIVETADIGAGCTVREYVTLERRCRSPTTSISEPGARLLESVRVGRSPRASVRTRRSSRHRDRARAPSSSPDRSWTRTSRIRGRSGQSCSDRGTTSTPRRFRTDPQVVERCRRSAYRRGTAVPGVELIPLTHARDLRGSLAAVEFAGLPFVPRRVFAVYGVPDESVRGAHAHRACGQLLICASGEISSVADDGDTRQEFRLTSPKVGLYIPPLIWSMQYRYSPEAVLVVLAELPYDPDDYVRDYEGFLELIVASARLIPVADPRRAVAAQRADLEASLARVLDGGRYVLGPEHEPSKPSFAAYLGVAHCVGVATGTDALEIALRAVGCVRGRRGRHGRERGFYAYGGSCGRSPGPLRRGRSRNAHPYRRHGRAGAHGQSTASSSSRTSTACWPTSSRSWSSAVAGGSRSSRTARRRRAPTRRADGRLVRRRCRIQLLPDQEPRRARRRRSGRHERRGSRSALRRCASTAGNGSTAWSRRVAATPASTSSRLRSCESGCHTSMPGTSGGARSWRSTRGAAGGRRPARRARRGGLRRSSRRRARRTSATRFAAAAPGCGDRHRRALPDRGPQAARVGASASGVNLPVTEHAVDHVLTLPCFPELADKEVDRVCEVLHEL